MASEKEPLSLATSIFVPFAGISSSHHVERRESSSSSSMQQATMGKGMANLPPPPLTKEEKLTKIMLNLDLHQEAVRRNMLGAIERRVKELTAAAEQELASMEVSDAVEMEEERRQREEDQESLRKMLESLRTACEEGKRYEEKEPDWSFKTQDVQDGEGDVQMQDPRPRTRRLVRKEWSAAIKELITEGVKEMVKYDAHAQETYGYYKSALGRAIKRSGGEIPRSTSNSASSSAANSRRNSSSAPASTRTSNSAGSGVSSSSTPGILKNRNDDPRIHTTESLKKKNNQPPPPPGYRGTREAGWIDPRRR